MNKLTILFLTCLLALKMSEGNAQVIETITLDTNKKFDGLLVHNDGFIYATDGWNGNSMYKINSLGRVTLFVNGLSGPINMVEDSEGNIFVTEWISGQVKKITPDGTISTFASSSARAGALGINKDGEIFVNIRPFSSGRSTLRKYSKDGGLLKTYFDNKIFNPSGIAFDDAGNMYLSELFSGELIKVTRDDSILVLGKAPTPSGPRSLGKLVFHDDFLWATDLGNHVVYKISLDGNFSILAGRLGVQGTDDGMGENARFINPNGFAVNRSTNEFYVKKAYIASNTLRKISFAPTAVLDKKPLYPEQIQLRQNYPNPFNPTTNISFDITSNSHASLQIFDVRGTLISTLFDEVKLPGNYSIAFDASQLASGVYFYRLFTSNSVRTRKMLFVK